jgi:hypothetical protein
MSVQQALQPAGVARAAMRGIKSQYQVLAISETLIGKYIKYAYQRFMLEVKHI